MKLVIFAFLSMLLAIPASASELSSESLYSVPFQWKNQKGDEVALSDFKGSPVVLTLAYTRCKTACPMTMQRVKRLAAAVNESTPGTKFVIISLDPAHDSPETMAKFKEQYKLEEDNWHLLTGSESDLRKLTVLLGYAYQRQEDSEIAHSNKIVALDSEGRIRFEVDGLSSDLDPFIAQFNQLFHK